MIYSLTSLMSVCCCCSHLPHLYRQELTYACAQGKLAPVSEQNEWQYLTRRPFHAFILSISRSYFIFYAFMGDNTTGTWHCNIYARRTGTRMKWMWCGAIQSHHVILLYTESYTHVAWNMYNSVNAHTCRPVERAMLARTLKHAQGVRIKFETEKSTKRAAGEKGTAASGTGNKEEKV